MKPAHESVSSRPKPCASLKKPHESCPFAAPCGPRTKKNDCGQRSAFPFRKLPVRAFDSRAQRFSPPLARQRSSCPPPSPNLVRTHLMEKYQALRDSAPCLSRAATLPKATKLELRRGAHLKTPPSANHTAAASQPTGRIAKAASWLHLSRVSPALHPPERPSHTHTPKPGFGGRGHEMLQREPLLDVRGVPARRGSISAVVPVPGAPTWTQPTATVNAIRIARNAPVNLRSTWSHPNVHTYVTVAFAGGTPFPSAVPNGGNVTRVRVFVFIFSRSACSACLILLYITISTSTF